MGEAAAPNGATQSVGVGPVTCPAGEIVLANSGSNSIFAFDRMAAGVVAPLRSIAGLQTGLATPDDPAAPRGVVVDAAHREIFATAGKAIRVYALEASGDMAPLRSIAGASTGLLLAEALAIDPVHDEIFVIDSRDILVFARDASGDVAPLRRLPMSGTVLTPTGIAVDTASDELVVVADSSSPSAPPSPQSVRVYPRAATDASAVLRVISGAATKLTAPWGVAVDPTHGEIAVTNVGTTTDCVVVFSRTASGNVAPLRTISGAAQWLYGLHGIAFDEGLDQILVVNSLSGAMPFAAYARTASGEATPLRTIAPYPGMASTWALTLLPENAYCALGDACAASGCMPAGSVNCAGSLYCPAGTSCGSATCAGICPFGTGCPTGSVCASGGCMPAGGADCGGGVHCAPTFVCSWNGQYCVPADGTDCLNGRYCAAGLQCHSGGLHCMPSGVVDCGDGYYCPSGTQCARSGAGMMCQTPSPPPGGAYCYSTSACIPGALSGNCQCAGATTPGQCVSGLAACSGVGGPCGDGVHACCVGETCIYNQCEAGCGQCAGKGCQL